MVRGDIPAAATAAGSVLVNSPRAAIPKHTRAIVFATETTGRTKFDLVVQLAVVFLDDDGHVLQAYDRIWQLPKKRYVSKGAYGVHGITTARTREEGVPAKPHVAWFSQVCTHALQQGIALVAFNAAFDCRLLAQTAKLYGVAWGVDASRALCTFSRSRVHSSLRTLSGSRKGFTNSELYFHFFKRPPEARLHNALDDTLVTASTFVRGRASRWW